MMEMTFKPNEDTNHLEEIFPDRTIHDTPERELKEKDPFRFEKRKKNFKLIQK